VPTCFFELGVVKRSRLVQRPAVSEVARVEAMLGDQSFESQRFTGISGSAERSDAILSGNVRGRDVSTARGQERKIFLNRPHPPLAPIMQIAPRGCRRGSLRPIRIVSSSASVSKYRRLEGSPGSAPEPG
jgi:hypothetical protein